MLLNGSGSIQSEYSYDAWGNPLIPNDDPNPFRWNGKFGYTYIPLTGFYHVGAREYDPRTARWLQRDPIHAASGDPNVYRYCLNSPINLKDPSGLYSVGEYVSDVGGVFVGYGKAIWGTLTAPLTLYNHFNENGLSWESAKGLVAGAVQALGQGLGSSDPREFGEAFGTVLLMAAPGLKKVPSLRGTRTPCEVPSRSIHARYADGTPVHSGHRPRRLPPGPDPTAQGSHTRIRYDNDNGRVYQGREFNSNGNPVRDIDFTNPTYPSGTVRSGHSGPPHQHNWIPNNPNNYGAGFRRGPPSQFLP